ncbi:hypothetical protein [Actinoplanes subglobosus]|uniref:Uncharacterized protein n=1 Tax=Actinoplanes subglobosus TaxID=1547892 RepID=A0ABV8J8R5_9ACTN
MRLRHALAVAGILLVTVAAPARAERAQRDGPVSAAFPDIDVPVGGTAIDLLGPNLWSTAGEVTLTGVTVGYELSGATGVRIAPNTDGRGDCEMPSATRVVCRDPRDLTFEGETVEQYLPVTVKASSKATAGDTGKITITVTADDLAPITGVSTVHVVDGRENLPVTGPMTGWFGLLLLGAGTVLVAVCGASRRGSTRVARH